MKKSSSRRREPKAARPRMPGYGMPRGTKGLLPWTWAEERLRKSHNYYLMTVRSDAAPHAMPVWGLWADACFYFSTGAQSVKARNLALNRSCVVCTENPAEAVIVEGTAWAIDSPSRIAELSPHYAKKYKGYTLDPKMGSIFEVRPKVVFGLREKTFTSSTRWTF